MIMKHKRLQSSALRTAHGIEHMALSSNGLAAHGMAIRP
jgi:hypothetical protein